MSHSGERTIYFIVPIDGPGRIKIGFSRSPERRIYELSALSPYQLRIAAQAPGNGADEVFIHWRFRKYRAHREWFKNSPTIREAIDYIVKHGRLPDFLRRDLATENERYAASAWAGKRIIAWRKSEKKVSPFTKPKGFLSQVAA